jgi:hypothetical protein
VLRLFVDIASSALRALSSPPDYMRETFKRAQYRAGCVGLIEEWRPRGASKFILID